MRLAYGQRRAPTAPPALLPPGRLHPLGRHRRAACTRSAAAEAPPATGSGAARRVPSMGAHIDARDRNGHPTQNENTRPNSVLRLSK